MDGYRDFTFDPVRFPLPEVRKFIGELHSRGQKYVLIVDPGIKIDKGLKSYDEGVAKDIFMKNPDGSLLVGSVWPGLVHFPDFFHPGAQSYWTQCFKDFFEMAEVDGKCHLVCNLYSWAGIWIDMNEPSNECSGDCYNEPKRRTEGTFDPNFPSFRINNAGVQAPLHTRTSAMDSLHYGGIIEYDAHNLYGLMEAQATYTSLKTLQPGKRPFILSRSTFPGSGKYTAHWTGDNWSTWPHLYFAITGIMYFKLYGIPFN